MSELLFSFVFMIIKIFFYSNSYEIRKTESIQHKQTDTCFPIISPCIKCRHDRIQLKYIIHAFFRYLSSAGILKPKCICKNTKIKNRN